MVMRIYDPDRREIEGVYEISELVAEVMVRFDWANIARGYGKAAERWFAPHND